MTIMSLMLEQFKRHMRVTGNELDAELMQKLLAATSSAEHHIGKVIIPSELEVTYIIKEAAVVLRAPVIGVESVELDGVILDADRYMLRGQVLSIPGALAGQTLSVRYRAGYSEIPDDMMAAVMMHAAYMFNNPVDTVQSLPKASDALLSPYRSWEVIDDGQQA